MESAYLTEVEAAEYLGVSRSYFQDHVRPVVRRRNFAAQGATRPMWRFAVRDLDAWADSRVLQVVVDRDYAGATGVQAGVQE
jgi:hypothetical protein